MQLLRLRIARCLQLAHSVPFLRTFVPSRLPLYSIALSARLACMSTLSVLPGREDHYGGFIVDSTKLPADVAEFTSSLEHSLEEWKQQRKRGIWLKIPIEKVAFVPVAVETGGFVFHHAEAVGVGAFVLNDQGQVLAVQERSGPLRGKKVWKMPTGLVQVGENLSTAVEREVLEETESEIEAVTWMDLSDFMSQPFFQDRPAFTKMLDRCKAYAEGRYRGLAASELATNMAGLPTMQLVMHSHDDDDDTTPEAAMHSPRLMAAQEAAMDGSVPSAAAGRSEAAAVADTNGGKVTADGTAEAATTAAAAAAQAAAEAAQAAEQAAHAAGQAAAAAGEAAAAAKDAVVAAGEATDKAKMAAEAAVAADKAAAPQLNVTSHL